MDCQWQHLSVLKQRAIYKPPTKIPISDDQQFHSSCPLHRVPLSASHELVTSNKPINLLYIIDSEIISETKRVDIFVLNFPQISARNMCRWRFQIGTIFIIFGQLLFIRHRRIRGANAGTCSRFRIDVQSDCRRWKDCGDASWYTLSVWIGEVFKRQISCCLV